MFYETLTKTYPAIFHPEEDGGYFIEFPDIQGAYTGINENNLSYAMAMVQEALGLVLAVYIENNEMLPEPSAINALDASGDDFTTLVSMNVADYL